MDSVINPKENLQGATSEWIPSSTEKRIYREQRVNGLQRVNGFRQKRIVSVLNLSRFTNHIFCGLLRMDWLGQLMAVIGGGGDMDDAN
jgi:hypothetical protein